MARTKKVAPKWRRRPEDRPQQILQAALDVFGKRGLSNARLEDIAVRAGISKGTIYLYFSSKEELFREMIRQTAVVAIEGGEQDHPPRLPTEQLRDFLRRYWELVRSPAFNTIYRLVLSEAHQFPDLAEFYARDVVARSLEILSGIIRRGVDAGEFREINPMIAARMLAGLTIMNGLWRDERTGLEQMINRTDDEILGELADFCLRSIAPTESAFAQADGAPAGP